MWRDEFYDESTSFGYEDGVSEFSIFLQTTTYAKSLDSNTEPISLLGALQLWLYYGEGLTVCPTYESFMVATILVIEDWINHDRVSIGGSPLWPFEDSTPVALSDDGQGMVQRYPLLLIRREVFQQLRATRDAHDRDELFGLVNRITRHLGVPDQAET